MGSYRIRTNGSNVTPVICHTEASLGFGGQEIRTLTEMAWLHAHGVAAILVCQPESRLLKEAWARNLPVFSVRMRGVLDLVGLMHVRRLLQRQGVALVHTHSSIDSWLGGLAARSLGLPLIRSRHVSIPIRRRRALVYRLADRVITTGEAIRAIVVGAGVPASKVVSIPAGVDVTRFQPGVSGASIRQELGLTESSIKVVGLVANVRGSKGHREFIEAARIVSRVLPETRFLVVGDGIGFDDVRQRVRVMGLERAVIMTGFRHDIPAVMAALDLLVVPSTRSEGIPQVILQALAMGAPVVASRIGGIPEVVVDNETGVLVPPGEPEALASAIVSLLRNPGRSRRLGKTGQVRMQESYSLDHLMARTVRLYEELLPTALSPSPRS